MTPRPTNLDELRLLIAKRLDIFEFLDTLQWDFLELLERIDDEVFDEFYEELLQACDE